jgi:putative Mg2+ transporter-C (MgtC) family protein
VYFANVRFEFIFVRQDAVRGLTTAASIWVTAAIGTAAGAGLPVIAVAATAAYLFVAIVMQLLSKLLPTSGIAVSVLSVRYSDGRGILRDVLHLASSRGFAVDEMSWPPSWPTCPACRRSWLRT